MQTRRQVWPIYQQVATQVFTQHLLSKTFLCLIPKVEEGGPFSLYVLLLMLPVSNLILTIVGVTLFSFLAVKLQVFQEKVRQCKVSLTRIKPCEIFQLSSPSSSTSLWPPSVFPSFLLSPFPSWFPSWLPFSRPFLLSISKSLSWQLYLYTSTSHYSHIHTSMHTHTVSSSLHPCPCCPAVWCYHSLSALRSLL